MLHGDECAHMKGQYFVERIQINMIFAAALHILYLFNSLLLLWGRGSLRADVSYFLPPAEKGRLRNGVANRVPVSCCSGFKFRINYDNRVLFSVPESFLPDRSMIGGRTGLRGGI